MIHIPGDSFQWDPERVKALWQVQALVDLASLRGLFNRGDSMAQLYLISRAAMGVYGKFQ